MDLWTLASHPFVTTVLASKTVWRVRRPLQILTCEHLQNHWQLVFRNSENTGKSIFTCQWSQVHSQVVQETGEWLSSNYQETIQGPGISFTWDALVARFEVRLQVARARIRPSERRVGNRDITGSPAGTPAISYLHHIRRTAHVSCWNNVQY